MSSIFCFQSIGVTFGPSSPVFSGTSSPLFSDTPSLDTSSSGDFSCSSDEFSFVFPTVSTISSGDTSVVLIYTLTLYYLFSKKVFHDFFVPPSYSKAYSFLTNFVLEAHRVRQLQYIYA